MKDKPFATPEPGRPRSAASTAAAHRTPGTFAHASVASQIGQMIVRGDYAPGTILPNESDWGQMFGASRSVIREAVKILMAKNLLASRPKVGSWVEPRENWNLLDRDVLAWSAASPHHGVLLRALQELRAVIEPEAAALAALRRSEADLAAIDAACRGMAEAPNWALRSRADRRFHQAVLRAAGNELLMPLAALIDSALEQLFIHANREVEDTSVTQHLHDEIARCIRLQDPAAAQRAVRALLAHTDMIVSHSEALAAPGPERPGA